MASSHFEDLTGRKFGRWTVVERLPAPSNRTTWKCRCRCGNEGAVQGGHLKNGESMSCGRCHGDPRKDKK